LTESNRLSVAIGILDVRLALRQARSLKDKRRIVNSLKDRLRSHFNVSVAEVDAQDMIQTASIAVVQVSGDARYARGTLERVVQMVRQDREAQLTDYSIDVIHQ
jgi:uncharacterized protein YlxP (DUF503 family)